MTALKSWEHDDWNVGSEEDQAERLVHAIWSEARSLDRGGLTISADAGDMIVETVRHLGNVLRRSGLNHVSKTSSTTGEIHD